MGRPERRSKPRVPLTPALHARYGSADAVVLDITDAGARIEHLARLEVGRRGSFRLMWRGKPVEAEATVVSCRVHRFASGDRVTAVYQSGLFFSEYVDDAAAALRDLVSTRVARSLAGQLANARGIEATNEPLPDWERAADRGYVRCRLGDRWEKKWTRKSEQPAEGFTVPASESNDRIDQLCETYRRSSAEERELIWTLARASVEREAEMLKPLR